MEEVLHEISTRDSVALVLLTAAQANPALTMTEAHLSPHEAAAERKRQVDRAFEMADQFLARRAAGT